MIGSDVFVLTLVIGIPGIIAVAAIWLTLRSGRSLKPEDAMLVPTSRKALVAGYDKIVEKLAEIPTKIEIDRDYKLLRDTLSALTREIGRKPSPFRSWSKTFLKAVNILEKLQAGTERIQPMFENETLRLKEHAEEDFTDRIKKIQDCAEDYDEENCSTSISGLGNDLDKWFRLTEDWFKLRSIASAGIYPKGRLEEILAEDWGWLSHGLDNVFEDRELNEEFVWLPWGVLSNPELLSKLTGCIAEELVQRERDGLLFNAICAMSSTAAPLATMLAIHMSEKRRTDSKKELLDLIAIDNKTFKFFPDMRKPETAILLVDSGTQTGSHLRKAIKAAENSGARVVGAVCISFNDLLPQKKEKEKLPIVDSMLKDGRLIYFFKISKLYSLWKETRWNQ